MQAHRPPSTTSLLNGVDFVCAAHRGASADCPENTLAAFEEGVHQGANLVELDVRLTADGEVIVIHDDTFERTTGVAGRVWERTLADVRGLDAGRWFDVRFRGERIPTLREVLEKVVSRVPVNIELKGRPGLGLEPAVMDLVHELGCRDRVLISAFRRPMLDEIRRLDADVAIGLLYQDAPVALEEDARAVRAAFLHPGYGIVDRMLLDRAHSLGLRTLVWTVDDPATARALRGAGVAGVFTNHPGRMIRAFR